MKQRIKLILIPFMLLATLFLATACSGGGDGYGKHNADGYIYSVKYDANGGVFTGTSSVMVDSFNISQMEKNPQTGMVELKLVDPSNSDSIRGDWTPTSTEGDLILAGWYRVRKESTNSDGKVVYTYEQKFDFEKDVIEVDPSKPYSAENAQTILYAMWIPKFEIQFVDMDGKTLGDPILYNPTSDVLLAPHYSQKTGRIEMGKFPKVDGYTFDKAYYEDGSEINVGDTLKTGYLDKDGTPVNTKITVKVAYKEGNWYEITSAKQLSDINDASGHYVIKNDLDFSDRNAYWPSSFVNGNFTGSIEASEAEGCTIKNVVVEQTDTWSQTGLFGTLANGASIKGITFDNACVYINRGTRTPGSSYGVLAGTVSNGAVLENVRFVNSKLVINADTANWLTDDYAIGLLCGMGSFAEGSNLAAIDLSGITCEKTGNKPLTIEVDGNTVTLVAG